jgi:DNA-binding transcriptional regulator YhcF (GntR family)
MKTFCCWLPGADCYWSGLAMILSAITTDPLSERVPRGNLRGQATARLVTGIFSARLRSGQRLVVQQLAKTFEVSPTPVREALVELASLGLVDLLPNRGAIVRPFGPAEVKEISQIRRLLETEATRSACGRIHRVPTTFPSTWRSFVRCFRPTPMRLHRRWIRIFH